MPGHLALTFNHFSKLQNALANGLAAQEVDRCNHGKKTL